MVKQKGMELLIRFD